MLTLTALPSPLSLLRHTVQPPMGWVQQHDRTAVKYSRHSSPASPSTRQHQLHQARNSNAALALGLRSASSCAASCGAGRLCRTYSLLAVVE